MWKDNVKQLSSQREEARMGVGPELASKLDFPTEILSRLSLPKRQNAYEGATVWGLKELFTGMEEPVSYYCSVEAHNSM